MLFWKCHAHLLDFYSTDLRINDTVIFQVMWLYRSSDITLRKIKDWHEKRLDNLKLSMTLPWQSSLSCFAGFVLRWRLLLIQYLVFITNVIEIRQFIWICTGKSLCCWAYLNWDSASSYLILTHDLLLVHFKFFH